MNGLMMQIPLLVSSILEHAAANHAETEIVSRLPEGGLHRYCYRAAHARACQLANALARFALEPQARIGTLAWNTHRHFEIYYATSGSGLICHTINPRLFAEQIAYIINHAEDRYVFFDVGFAPLVEKLAGRCPNVRGWVAMTDRGHMPLVPGVELLCYEELLARESEHFEWPQFDENTASGLCYTSGTTGNPKGVLYSHRSTVLHAYALCLPDSFNLSARDCVLPIVPMFHVNAWGTPYACAMVGAKLVLPGAQLDGASLYELFEKEAVTMTAGVPTVCMNILQHVRECGLKFSTLRRAVIGGSACSASMVRSFEEDFGIEVRHAWGMTELSPLGSACALTARHANVSREELNAIKAKQGRPPYGVRMKVVDGEGAVVPRDGLAFGNLVVQGPWTCSGYFGEPSDASLPRNDGWFATGDVATLDAEGYIQITDRSKDVIKSGGEWISSIQLENIAVGHPAVAEAAVIGVRHPKWEERPLVVAVKKSGAVLTREELLKFFDGKCAKWWRPDDVVFVDELPHTATGKLLKNRLREQFRDYRFAGAE